MNRQTIGAALAGLGILILLFWYGSIGPATLFTAGIFLGWTMAGRPVGWDDLPETTTDAPAPKRGEQ